MEEVKLPLLSDHKRYITAHQLGIKRLNLEKYSLETRIYSHHALQWLVEELRIRQEQDWHAVVFISGKEGVGKSTLAAHIAWMLGMRDPRKVCFSAEEVIALLRKSPPKSVIWYDEIVEGAYRRDAMSRMNRRMVKILTSIRKRNHVFLMCVPNANLLDAQVWDRGTFRCHCTAEGGSRGRAYIQLRRESGTTKVAWKNLFGVVFHAFPDRTTPDYEEQKRFWEVYDKRKDDFIDSLLAEELGEKELGKKLRDRCSNLLHGLISNAWECPTCGEKKRFKLEELEKMAGGDLSPLLEDRNGEV